MKSKNIPECILELTGTIVKHDSENKYGGAYRYSSLPHLQSVVLPVVKKHKLILTQTVTNETVRSEMLGISKKATEPKVDKLMTFAHCVVETILLDPETGEQHSCTVYGDKVDQSSDKSLGAHTVARRYGLMTLFNLIVTDDDLADPDSNDSDIRSMLGGASSLPKKTTLTSNNSSSDSLKSILGI